MLPQFGTTGRTDERSRNKPSNSFGDHLIRARSPKSACRTVWASKRHVRSLTFAASGARPMAFDEMVRPFPRVRVGRGVRPILHAESIGKSIVLTTVTIL